MAAIPVGAPFRFNGEDFLDNRQGLANTLDDLLNWDVSIPEGFEVYVKSEKSWFSYDPSVTTRAYGHFRKRANTTGQIPIYDEATLKTLDPLDIPDKYIIIPSVDDLEGEVVNNIITTSINGTYVDILFNAVRKLQSEVARLRNSMKYGLYSYSGTRTAMSDALGTYTEDPDLEPLWAIEESDLSAIATDDVLGGHGLDPVGNVSVNTESGYITVTGETTWKRDPDIFGITDPKLFIYLTSTTKDIKIGLENIDNKTTIPEPPVEDFILDLSKIESLKAEIYNIMIIISRAVWNSDKTKKSGENYIWVSMSDAETGRKVAEGFLMGEDLVSGKSLLSTRYTIGTITFNNLKLTKFNLYSKYQDFSSEVIPTIPDDRDYKYGVAHITIRSVATLPELEGIKQQLPNNELIFVESSGELYIKNNGTLISIGKNSSGDDDTMTETEVINILKDRGIIYNDSTGLQISKLSDLTFIHQGTGKSFNLTIGAEGDLESTELPEKSLEEIIKDLSTTEYAIDTTTNIIRGFGSRINASLNMVHPNQAKDTGDYSDRIKIASIYMPLTTDKVFGCSHAYIELENTSTLDFPLEGCYLHFLHPDNSGNPKVEHLELKGVIPAGSTYLIRGKQYATPGLNSNIYINVDDFDQEWYIDKGVLLDTTCDATSSYGVALTYGQSSLSHTTQLRLANPDTSADLTKAPYVYPWWHIDSMAFVKHIDATNKPWAINTVTPTSNSIIRNQFELDPAKQAFQALTAYDSSRIRTDSNNDVQVLDLNKEFISFPHTEEVCPVSKFAPRSSKQKKNVSTDKSKLNQDIPNMVTCSFGIDPYTTRCFNWISSGNHEEYVWIKYGDTWKNFQSYTRITAPKPEGSEVPRRKEFEVDINNTIYAGLTGTFPGDGTYYTSHKCIVYVAGSKTSGAPTEYTYKVGRGKSVYNESQGKSTLIPDDEHCSEEMKFTLYPTSYTPRIYQTTDQQGFHWIEYQAWAAAAEKVNERIEQDKASDNIIPVLINTGDMTQNGTRINEWLDYYNGGKPLFDHLEQVNCVGNNDLCGTNFELLGTGDDKGKSNSYYFHVFYCYEVPNRVPDVATDKLPGASSVAPMILSDTNSWKYVPSTYYIDFSGFRLLAVNSEITYENCNTWFNRHLLNQVVNVYTGWAVPSDATTVTAGYDGGFTTLYTILKGYLSNKGSRKVIAMCHEMPFTVITVDDLKNGAPMAAYRSVSGKSLVGSHLNQLTAYDTKSVYWFSRLLEDSGVHLCLGGHKHTYECTYKIREYYKYDNGTRDSLVNGPMSMPMTLETDSSEWIVTESGVSKNLSKFPLVNHKEAQDTPDDSHFYPYTYSGGPLSNAVTYFMCQATGYKLKSNKELPSNYQVFSQLIPMTTYTGGSAAADDNQQFPMFAIVELKEVTADIKLARITNILTAKHKFTQSSYGTGKMGLEWATPKSDSRYCDWGTTEIAIVNSDL